MKKSVFGFPLILLPSLFLTACNEAETTAASAPPPPEVTVSEPLKKKIVEWDEYIGRFQAVERIEVRARVSGYLDEIRFEDGDTVEQGDTLFVIDQRPFQIALDRANAQHELARNDYRRIENLRDSRVASQEDYENRQQQLRVAKADLDKAKLDLEFTEIKAPVTGRISRSRVDVGNLINGNVSDATLLTTIVSLDPIHFYFEASDQELLKYVRLHREGSRPGSHQNPNPVYVKLQDEKQFTRIGQMDFVDNEVDLGTGTIQGRAIFPNQDTMIYPGMFGRARLVGSGLYEALLVPDQIIGTDQSRKFVMIVNDQDQAEMKFVELGPIRDSGLRIVRGGLEETDRVIINGLQRARPGTTVNPMAGTIEESDEDILPLFEALAMSPENTEATELTQEQPAVLPETRGE